MKLKRAMTILLCLAAGLCGTLDLSAESCEATQQFDNLIVRLYKSKWGGCHLSAGQTYEYRKKFEDRYRSFTFMPDGQVMMFVSTEDDERLSRCTGSRCFHLLPFRKPAEPSWTDNGDGTVTLVLPSGHKAVFSTATGEPLSIEGFIVSLAPLQHITQLEKNRGFIEITPQKSFLLLDYGWRTGEVPMSQLWREITIRDGNGTACRARMSEVFKKDPRDQDEVVFLHGTNAKLKAFVQKKCPKISFPE
ncbi:MAG TPA: hypothetical protein PK307_00525 [Spirochaetota bacterium]|nr:hypothetical protein [Spirochaetota bacterium]HOD14164.1 hypothetical protein [Spirochaetota bacterium]HPN10739.1 hypothetical protein [Spirochaetota bacterium]HQL80655.1 hypothetical protein [Spirochaetota bacterium]